MTLVYLAGHGVQIGQRNYFFGINAKPDPKLAAKAAIDTNGAQLFETDATDVIASFYNGFGRTAPAAILLVLDSCRDDAIFDSAQEIVRARISDKLGGDERLISMMTEGAISAPKGADAPWGMSVFYASRFGNRILDDNGTSGDSRLAIALADKITKFPGANRVVYESGKQVSDDTYHLPPGQQQFPDSSGPLFGDPCIGKCGPATAQQAGGPNVVLGNPLSLLYHPAAFSSDPTESRRAAENAEVGSSTLRRSVTLLHTGAADSVSKTIEVFWCSASNGDENESRALHFASALATEATSGSTRFNSISDIRVTELSAADNNVPTNQINSDLLVYDPMLARFAEPLKSLAGIADVNPIRTGATRYVSAYFCHGAYPGPQSALVYIQVPPVGGLDPANEIKENLHYAFPLLDTSPLPDTSPKEFPSDSEVRFYDKNKEILSHNIAARLTSQIGVKFTARYFRRLATPNSVKLVEIWLSPKDVVAANEYIRVHPQAYR